MHTNIFKLSRMRLISPGKCLITLLFALSSCMLYAQNLNNPNKRGPLGTQVNTLSGNVFIERTDVFIPARMLDIDITFSYNSYLFTDDYGYGKGWQFNYKIFYRQDTAAPGARLILWGDGREDKYDSLPGGGYKSPKGFFSTLTQYQPGKYLLTEPGGMKYFFDNPLHRSITRMEEPNGNFINFSYTDTLLTALSNAAGQSITLTYNPQGKLATITDAIATPSRTWTYTYDAGGNLTEVKDPLNGKYKYSYLVNGPMKTIADKNNNTVDIIYFPDLSARELIGCNKRLSFSYDTATHSTSVTDHVQTGNQVTKYTYQTVEGQSWVTSMSGNCCGYSKSYEYDAQGNATKMTDANGQVYTYTYDSSGNMLTATDPLGQVSTYTYSNDFNKITSYTDPKGNLYSLTYDVKGNLLQLTAPGNLTYSSTYNALGDILSSTDPKGNVYNYNYDAWGNPVSVTGPNGYNAALSFDARGNLLAFTDARGNNSTAEYDILNRLKKITDPINNIVQFTYDAEGNMQTLKNENNETTQFSFDASNRLVQTTDAKGGQTFFTYDGMNNLLSVNNAMGNKSSFGYDKLNRQNSIKDPEGNTTQVQYDGNGNIISATLPNGRSVNYTYDLLNQLKSVSDGDGSIGSFTYDKNGNITSYTNGTGAVTSATYDNLNRINSITDPLGNTSSYVYDNNSNIITITDREGKASHYTYDGLNRVATYTDNNGFVITIGYDATGNMTSLTDQNNNVTNYTYDNLNRRKRMTYPDGKYNEANYDPEGNITSIRQTDGTIINYQYDTLNRIISRTLPGGEVYSFTYDKLGRVLTATNNNGTVNFMYDKLNRVISETFDGRTTNYTYNIAGRTQTITYPDGSVVQKEFDNRNRLVKIMKDSVVLVQYTYNNANQLTQKTFGNGAASIMQYDIGNRLSSISTTAASGTIQNSLFSYDKENNKTAITRLGDPTQSEQFTYDNGYRLTNYKKGPTGSPVIQNTYTYDAVGNRTAANLNGAATTYSINNLNQLTGVNGSSFTFDNKGNITYDGTFYKTYDAENRLIKDSSSPTNVVAYGYDAIGRRVTKTINGNLLKFTYSGAAQIEERDVANILLNSTVFTNFLTPVMNDKNGDRFYYHNNEMMSVEGISNSNGRLIEKYNYDVYGKMTRLDSLNNPLASSIAGNRFGFTGQEFDSATNSYRFFYRNYSPETGVFNQRDLIEYQDGMGMYQYVGNNPANGVDVWGLLGDFESFDPNSPRNVKYEKCGNNKIDWMTKAKFASYLFSTTRDVAEFGLKVTEGTVGGFVKKLGPVATGIDLGLKSKAAKDVFSNPKSTGFEMADATSDLVASGISAATGNVGGAIVGGVDGALEASTGKNIRQLTEAPIVDLKVQNKSDEGFAKWASDYGIPDAEIYNYTSRTITPNDNFYFIKNLWTHDKGTTYLMWKRSQNLYVTDPCSIGGTRIRVRWVWDVEKQMWVLVNLDPNLIVGPDGQPDKKWVSVNDRMPYTILFENDKSASARVRYIKITSPVQPKQDPTTLELGSVGFNNESFDIPAGRSFYYNRLNAVDSTGMFVDLTAGYDVINNQLFWEFQAIDPVTLLPPTDPLAGFLFLQDSTQAAYGHGFVNFSIKPRTDAQTLDTIAATAGIIFDQNDILLTNTHTNTIDALAPVSQLNTITGNGSNPITLSWTGADDVNGCGIAYYTIYVSTDQINYSVLFPKIVGTDTTFSLTPGYNYCFFVLATDRVGNMETLRQGVIKCYNVGTPLPVNWLYFTGSNQQKNNLLKWGTTSEQNSKEFWLERSFDGTVYDRIAVIPAAGNSTTTTNYQYLDRNIDQHNQEVFLYRLKQVDMDNNFRYSSIVKLYYKKNNNILSIVYPNPTNGNLNMLIGDPSLIGTEAVVYDVNGRMLKRVEIKAMTQPVNLNEFVNGIYMIRLANKETLKVIKQ